MTHERLPDTATDADVLAAVDRWVAVLEAGDYDAARAMTAHDCPDRTAEDLRSAIEGYGHAASGQHVTRHGAPSGSAPRRDVTRWPEQNGTVGDVWYDPNIDGAGSDLTATFYLVPVADGLVLSLSDIRVM